MPEVKESCMIKIGFVGTGYVGLVTGVCLSDFGWQVSCVDQNEEIIRQLNKGKATIYELSLEDQTQKMFHLLSSLCFTHKR